MAAAAAPRLAWFVTPHGFGHAARAAAAMGALQRRRAARGEAPADLTVVTTVPGWFFADAVAPAPRMIEEITDVGLVQRSPTEEDLPATADRLDAFYPPTQERIDTLATRLRALRVDAVVCDIAPLGIEVAAAAGVPSVLVENFTWDWIYRPYLTIEPRLAPHVARLQAMFARAERRVQTVPVCVARDGVATVAPVARRPRTAPDETRAALGVAPGQALVLLSMGGHPASYPWLDRLRARDDVVFAVAAPVDAERRDGNVVSLPPRSRFYHPDLTAAADAVVGKLGYSTVAEVLAAGAPFAHLGRRYFPEADVLGRFVAAHGSGLPLADDEFGDGRWLARLDELLALPRRPWEGGDGADELAAYLETELP